MPRNRPAATPGAALEFSIDPPRETPAGWLLRLRVVNRGDADTLVARVTQVAGTRRPATDLSVALGWRNGATTPEFRLDAGARELVRLALVQLTSPASSVTLLTASADDRASASYALAPDGSVFLSVALQRADNGETVAAAHVRMSFDANSSAHAPVVTLCDPADVPVVAPASNGQLRRRPASSPEFSRAIAPAGRERSRPRPNGPRDQAPVANSAAASASEGIEPRKMSPHDAQHLGDVLRCSVCRSTYAISDAEVVCNGCGLRYPVIDGIPVLTNETTIATLLEETDYDAIGGVNDALITRTGAEWIDIIKGLGIAPERVLEVGSGTGVLTRGLLEDHGVQNLTATDVSLKFLRKVARETDPRETSLSFVVCDANDAHFRPESFDLVLGRSILHHLLHYDETLRQCHAVLRPGGAAVFFEPILQGKIFLTLLMGLVIRADGLSDDPQLTPVEIDRMRRLMGHHMKAKIYPQDAESLDQLEDKYVFDIDDLRRVGMEVGFREVEFRNNGELNPSYWPLLWWTLMGIGIDPKKIDRYRWLSEELANTYGVMFRDHLATPMAYFVFRK